MMKKKPLCMEKGSSRKNEHIAKITASRSHRLHEILARRYCLPNTLQHISVKVKFFLSMPLRRYGAHVQLQSLLMLTLDAGE